MKEEVFIELGFKKTIVTAKESGSSADWYYYELNISSLCLLTSSSDEIKDNNWCCYFFEFDNFKIDNEADLRELVCILQKAFKNRKDEYNN